MQKPNDIDATPDDNTDDNYTGNTSFRYLSHSKCEQIMPPQFSSFLTKESDANFPSGTSGAEKGCCRSGVSNSFTRGICTIMQLVNSPKQKNLQFPTSWYFSPIYSGSNKNHHPSSGNHKNSYPKSRWYIPIWRRQIRGQGGRVSIFCLLSPPDCGEPWLCQRG